MTRIVLTNVSKTFAGRGKESFAAVDQLNLAIEAGELLVLVGPSGCGKTTSLRLIAGLDEVTSGTIAFDAQPMNGVDPQDRDVAMVFQRDALLPHLTILENISLGLRLRQVGKSEVESRTREALELFGLAGLKGRRPGSLSAGERQRAALARAFVRRPRAFLLDEPMASLDGPVRSSLRLQIIELQRRSGATMVYVTHDQLEAMAFSRRIAVMHRGAIQQVGLPEELYAAPANAFVAGFLGSPPMNLFRGTLLRQGGALWFHEQGDGSNLAVCLTEAQSLALESHVGKMIQLGMRPEHILDAGSDKNVAYGSEVQSSCLALEPMGHEWIVRLQGGAGGMPFQARFPGERRPAVHPGETQPVLFDMSRAFFFESSGPAIRVLP